MVMLAQQPLLRDQDRRTTLDTAVYRCLHGGCPTALNVLGQAIPLLAKVATDLDKYYEMDDGRYCCSVHFCTTGRGWKSECLRVLVTLGWRPSPTFLTETAEWLFRNQSAGEVPRRWERFLGIAKELEGQGFKLDDLVISAGSAEMEDNGDVVEGAGILHQIILLLADVGVEPGDPTPATILEELIQVGAKVDTHSIMLAARANLQGCVSVLAKQMGL